MTTDEWSASKVFSLLFRVAAVGMSLYSGVMTATSSETVQDGTVTSSDYPSLTFASVGDLVSAVLEALVLYLELVGEEKMSKFVDLLDKIVLTLKSSSTAVLFAVDEITSCGPRRRSVCSQARRFCSRIKLAAGLSLGGTLSAASAAYFRRAPAALTLAGKLLVWVCCLRPPFRPTIRSRSPSPPPPRPPKHKVELQVTGGASPCHPPTGVRLSVSSHYDDEDD